MTSINKLIIQNLLIIMVITIFICQTVAYSALSTTMNISGKGFAKIQTDVRITDLKVKVPCFVFLVRWYSLLDI